MTAEKTNDIIEGAKNILGEQVFNTLKWTIEDQVTKEIAERNKYNGWTNKATWLIPLYFESNLYAICDNIDDRDIPKSQWVNKAADMLKNEFMEHIYDCGIDTTSVEYTLLADACYEINWQEIAEHLADEHKEWPNEQV